MEAKPQLLRNFMQRRYAGLRLSCYAAQFKLCRGIRVLPAPVRRKNEQRGFLGVQTPKSNIGRKHVRALPFHKVDSQRSKGEVAW